MYKTELPEAMAWTSDSNDFDFWTRTLDGIPVVNALTDEIDVCNAEAMRRELLAAAARSKVIVVDMSAEPFCDSYAMDVLDEIAGMLAGQGGELRAVITRRLTLTCLLGLPSSTGLVRVFPTLDEALFTARDWKTQLQAA